MLPAPRPHAKSAALLPRGHRLTNEYCAQNIIFNAHKPAPWRFSLTLNETSCAIALETPTLPISGTASVFPVRRIYCVGRNYVEHIREMKEGDERDLPFFSKNLPTRSFRTVVRSVILRVLTIYSTRSN